MPKVFGHCRQYAPARAADVVVLSRASAYDGFTVELADLRDWPLSIFGERRGTIGDISDPT